MSDKITAKFSDGHNEISVEGDQFGLWVTGKDGSVWIPLRMVHMVAEHMKMVLEKAKPR